MAEDISSLGRQWLRDYNIDGIPSSGENDPEKSEGRHVFDVIDANFDLLSIAAAAGVTVQKSTLTALNDDLAHAANTLAVVFNDPTAANNIFYYKVGASMSGSWVASDLGVEGPVAAAIAAVQPLVDEAEGYRDEAEDFASDTATVAHIAQRFVDGDHAVAGRTWKGSMYPLAAFVAWGIGWGGFDRTVSVRGVEMVLDNLPATDKLRARVWRRPLADALAAGSLVNPGSGVNDVLVFDTVWDTTDLIFGTPIPPIPTSVRFPMDGSIEGNGDGSMDGAKLTGLPVGFIDIIKITATKSGAEAYIAAGSAPAVTGILHEFRGAFANSGGPLQEVSSAANLAFIVYEVAAAEYATEGKIAPLFERPIVTGVLDALQSPSTSIDLPAVRIERYSGDQIIPAQSVTIAALTTEAKSQNATLSLSSNTYLEYQFARSVVVTRVSDSTVATIGTNVFVDQNRGIVMALQSGWAVPVTIAYTGHKARYDLVGSDQSTGATDETLIVTAGTGDAVSPAEYRPGALAGPAKPFNVIPLFAIFTMPDRSEVIHLAGGSMKFLRFGRAGDLLELREKNAYALRKTRGRFMSGQSVIFGGDGDSITAMGDRAAAQNTTPDGASRDVIGYFNRYSTALRAMIPQSGGHIACGWNNYIRNVWAESYPAATVTYQNWGIAGTDSSSGSFNEGGVDYYNGTHPTRMNASGKAAVKVWNIAFGMNEIGQGDNTPANLTILGRAYQANGSDVIFTTTAMQNAVYNNRDIRAWKQEQMDIIRAAETIGAAYVPLWWILGPGNEGMSGLSRWTHSDATMVNHPGFEELKAIGEFSSFILGL